MFLGIHVLLANLFVIGLTTITNFLGCKYLVFSAWGAHKKLDFLLYRYKYLIRYVFIGLGSIVIETIIITILRSFNQTTLISNISIITGFIIGLLFSYLLNSKINFYVPKERNLRCLILLKGLI